MKKSILIPCALITSLLLTAYVSTNTIPGESTIDFGFRISSRYDATVTKENLQSAISVVDILPSDTDWPSYPIHSLHVIDLTNEVNKNASGNDIRFTDEQLNLLKTLDYSDNFKLVGNCKGKHKDVPDREVFDLTYHLSIIPEETAEYPDGFDGLIQNLMSNSKDERRNIAQDKLEFGRIVFKVTKEGKISDVRLDATCGYEDVDKVLTQLIIDTPGKWKPAKTMEGNLIEQEFTFFYGRVGC